MVTKGGHGSLAAWVAEIRREHPHIKVIAQESLKMAHAHGLLQSRNRYYHKSVMGAPLLETVQESAKPWHDRGLEYLSRPLEIHYCR